MLKQAGPLSGALPQGAGAPSPSLPSVDGCVVRLSEHGPHIMNKVMNNE